MFEIIELNEFDPETWAQCPVCGNRFEQTPGRGRERIYCSRACQQKQFRHAKSVTKLTPDARTALVQQQMAVGDWRFHSLPEWPHYTCLGCGAAVGRGPAWYDWNDFNTLRGVYRRVVCGNEQISMSNEQRTNKERNKQ